MKGPKINGKRHDVIVLRVLEWDAHGRPSKAEIGYEETTFKLDDPTKPNVFMTAFVDADSVERATKH